MTPPRSAVIVAVPESEPLVGELREIHSPERAAGFPAHVTLFVPFLPPEQIDADVLAKLARVIASEPTFDFELASVGCFPSTLFLDPAPHEPFVRLTHAIAAAFPPLLPYEGEFESVLPHLTVADHVAPDVMDALDVAVGTGLPITCRAEQASLIVRASLDAPWEIHAVLPLGTRSAPDC